MASQLSKRRATVRDIRACLEGWTAVSHPIYRAELESSYENLCAVLEILPENTGRVLQVGAAPYFLTLLLREFGDYQTELVNYFSCTRGDTNTILQECFRNKTTDEELCLSLSLIHI